MIDERHERGGLLAHLERNGVSAPIVGYPAHSTIEKGKRLRGELTGTFTKNLLLKEKKGQLFFVTAHEDTDIDLKTLHTKLGARGRSASPPQPRCSNGSTSTRAPQRRWRSSTTATRPSCSSSTSVCAASRN